jgi:hypothetical protein
MVDMSSRRNLVFDDALQAVASVDDGYAADEIAKAVDTIRQRTKSGRVPQLDGVGFVAKRRAANNYGHYLLYMVPLALLGKKLFGQINPRYLIHQTTSPMHDVVLRSFRLLGINLDRVLIPLPVLFSIRPQGLGVKVERSTATPSVRRQREGCFRQTRLEAKMRHQD